MSSELLGAAQNVLKGNLGGAWDINKGYADAYTDLGIARKFGAAAAAYSLRDIGAMNGRVVRVRRDSDDDEEDFSANQVQSGALETFVGASNNGFVSIWYDQSGNANNATQASADIQPIIVQNGGQLKLQNGTPSLGFNRPFGKGSKSLTLGSKITTEPYTFFSVGLTDTSRSLVIFSENVLNAPVYLTGGTTGGGSAFYNPDNSTSSGHITTGVDTDSDFYTALYSGENGGDNYIMRFNGAQVHTASRGAAGDGIQTIGAYDTINTEIGFIESWVLYTSDLTADFDEI